MWSCKAFKKNIVKIFNGAGFKLHKWSSNVAKLSKGVRKTEILGISWTKQDDQLEVKFLQRQTEATKRGILQCLASVYDPVELISPTLLCGKMIFRDTCNLKIGWDMKLSDQLKRKWERWKQSLPTLVSKDGVCVPLFILLHINQVV